MPSLSSLSVALLLLAAPLGPAAAEGRSGFGFSDVAALARSAAKAPFQEPKGRIPDYLLKLSDDDWRDIRFHPEHALWRGQGLPFEVEFFHPGGLYNRIVRINSVDARGVHPLAFSPGQFDYGRNKFASQVPQDLGYAGWRLHYPINEPGRLDEVIVFLGASYYRAVGRHQAFGLSARGVAVDTGLPSGEEFPWFKEFWIVTPAKAARSVEVYALLESRRVAGAYRFTITPGPRTEVDVQARLFPRAPIALLGVAPLTSMYLYGENSQSRRADFRPEVHDSDGLLVALSTSTWLWRPLLNPKRINVSVFRTAHLKGFGLQQRDRDFDHYQDLETRQDLRPSSWVVPQGNWGPGAVELVELPSPEEIYDNIVAFWSPQQPLQPGRGTSFFYKQYWYDEDRALSPQGRAVATRHDRGASPGSHRFVIDFTGEELAGLPADTVLRGVITIGSGSAELLEQQVVKNPVTQGWRLVFQVRPKSEQPVALQALLTRGPQTLTETWSYVLLPES
jgi:glucans biosynthesis protein